MKGAQSEPEPDWAFLSSGRLMALVGPDLTVGWLCVPEPDGTPVLAAFLDPVRGGRLTTAVEGCVPSGRAYVGGLVLATTLAGEGVAVEVTDWMPWGGLALIREVRVRARPEVRWVTVDHAVVPTRLEGVHGRRDREGWVVSSPTGVLVVAGPARTRVRVGPTGEGHVRLIVAVGANLAQARAHARAARGVTRTAELARWERWHHPNPPVPRRWRGGFRRSEAVLRGLTHPAGGILAAATASFPATPGGADNWDYRFTWVRDGTLSALALDLSGHRQEALAFYRLAVTWIGPDGHIPRPLFRGNGQPPPPEAILPLAGPGGEVPVRVGNEAGFQLQIDSEGTLILGLRAHVLHWRDRDLHREFWGPVRAMADWLALHGEDPESGVWEFREYTAHWAYGQAVTIAGLAAAARWALSLGERAAAARWRAAAHRARERVDRFWSEERGAFVASDHEAAGLDISVLALGLLGVVAPDDPRYRATLRRVGLSEAEGGLVRAGGVLRYEGAAMPFTLATFLLGMARVGIGERAGLRVLERALRSATPLGLIAEHHDPCTGRQWGNRPQGFSHAMGMLAALMVGGGPGTSSRRWRDHAATVADAGRRRGVAGRVGDEVR